MVQMNPDLALALGVDARRLLAECRPRIMYLVSTRDEVIARKNLDEVLAHAPQTEVAEIEGPHLALVTNPVQSAACIARFLRRESETGSLTTRHEDFFSIPP